MRLDSFLSAARLFKSRSMAGEAIGASMVFVDNLPAKPARKVMPGSIIEIDLALYYKKIEILELPPKNMPKSRAASLYRTIEERIKD